MYSRYGKEHTHNEIWFKACTTSSKTEPHLSRYCLLTIAITKSLVSLLFIKASHFQIMNHVVRLINSMGISSFIQSLCCKMSFFITRNALCYAIMMAKAFCMSIMVIMVETWMRKANRQIHIPNMCIFHWAQFYAPSIWKRPNHQAATWCLDDHSKKQFHIRISMLISTVVRHSAVVLFRSAVLRGSSCSWAYM